MKKTLVFVLIQLIGLSASAHTSVGKPTSERADKNWTMGSHCTFESSQLDDRIPANKALFQFRFDFELDASTYILQYSVNGSNRETIMEKGERLNIITWPGEHIFEFLVDGYAEAFSDTVLINAQRRDEYVVHLAHQMAIMVDPNAQFVTYKPIIYLYPPKKTEVTVTIDIAGTEKFLYPPSEGKWEFSAMPNGDLKFDDATYNYLFWEANSTNSFPISEARDGFFVERENVVPFLEARLSEANFTSKEKADFITFWGPRLAQNPLNFVHFEFNENCNRYAELTIEPTPESIYRIYMIFAPVKKAFAIEKQEMKAVNRKGFYVIEWGGQEQLLDELEF